MLLLYHLHCCHMRYAFIGLGESLLNLAFSLPSSSSFSVALQLLKGPWPIHTGGFLIYLYTQ
jgi:hypothetical protein